MNEGDLLVTALSLRFATTALREQPASAPTVCDKVRCAAGASAAAAAADGGGRVAAVTMAAGPAVQGSGPITTTTH